MIVSETAFSMESSGRKHLVGALVTDDGNVIGGGGLGIRMGAHPNYQRRIVEEGLESEDRILPSGSRTILRQALAHTPVA